MATVMKSVDVLKNEIEKTRQNLQQTDLTIRRITGRDENSRPSFPARNAIVEETRRTGMFSRGVAGRGRLEGLQRPDTLKRRLSGGPVAAGRRTRNAHNRDSGDEDDEDKVNLSLASSVITATKDKKSREEVIQQQNKDREGKARNRRMFGLLVGTLKQFEVDERKKEHQELKRKEVEKKLEVKHKEEVEKMKQEKQQLFLSKKHQQFKLRQLEVKMEIVQLHEEWEEQSKQLMHYIRTDCKPHIYWLPKVHNSTSSKKLEQSKKLIEDVVAKRRGMLDEEINSILKAEEEGHFHAEKEEDENEPPSKRMKTGKDGKSKLSNRLGRSREHKDGDQDESDLDLNHDGVGVDYQVTMEHDDAAPHQPEASADVQSEDKGLSEVVEPAEDSTAPGDSSKVDIEVGDVNVSMETGEIKDDCHDDKVNDAED